MDNEAERLRAWIAAVARGTEALDRGEIVPYTRELLEEITRKATVAIERGTPVHPDVLP